MKRNNGFIKLDHELMRTSAWQALSAGAGWLLIDMWSRHNGHNNGEIVYSVRDAERRLGCGRRQAIRFLHELEDKGFIVAMRRGSFDRKAGARRREGTTWCLTMERCAGKQPTRDYLQWANSEA